MEKPKATGKNILIKAYLHSKSLGQNFHIKRTGVFIGNFEIDPFLWVWLEIITQILKHHINSCQSLFCQLLYTLKDSGKASSVDLLRLNTLSLRGSQTTFLTPKTSDKKHLRLSFFIWESPWGYIIINTCKTFDLGTEP